MKPYLYVGITLLLIAVPQVTLASATCKGGATLSGTLKTKKGNLKFSNKPVEVLANHCIDVDRKDQGGCVSAYRIKTKTQRGCGLQVTLLRHPVNDIFEVRNLKFFTDSYCQGWLDPVEGLYQAESVEFTVRAPKQVKKGQEIQNTACFNAQIKIKGGADFRHPSSVKTLDSSFAFRISGVVQSSGAVNQPCLREPPKVTTKKRRKAIAKAPVRRRQQLAKPTTKTFRLDLAGGAWRGGSYASARASAGRLMTLQIAMAPEVYAGAGLGIILGNEWIELHPRLMVLGYARFTSMSDAAINAGATLRLFLTEVFGLHFDASTSLAASNNRGFPHASLGFSIRW